MASTYSPNLAIELIGSGEQSGTWGTTTNTNLGTLLEQAISGVTTTACTGGTDTITIPNGASGTARNMFLELTGTGGGSLVVPANKKLYFIYNNTSLAITVKVTGQTGVSVPAAAKTILVMNSAGTDVVNATNYFSALTLGAALPVASGGTGFTSTTAYSVYTGNSAGTGFTAIANGTTGQVLTATTSGAPSWAAPATNGTVTSVAALTLGTTGTDLSSTVATGTTTPVITLQVPTASAANRGALSSTDWSTFNGKQAALVSGTNIKTVNSTTLLGSGDVSVGVTSVTGTAPVVSSGGATPAISMPVATSLANGYLSSTDWTTFNNKGSGSVTSVAQSFTGGLISVAGSPITTSGTLALTVAGTSGGIPYFSSASTWATSAALTASALVVGGGAGAAPATTTTGTGVVTALGVNTGTAGAFVVNGGALGTPSSGTLTNCTFPTLNQNTTGNAATATTAAGLSSTLAVSSGGTGATSATAYAVQCGGTTSTGAHQSVASVGTAGQVLTSNGAGALPTFQTAAVGQLSYALYTTAGTATWTCPTGVTKVLAIVIGGGAGYSGAGGSAGHAGGIAIGAYTVVPGTGYSYTVGGGSGGTGGTAGSGGTSSFSSFCSATGGGNYAGAVGVGSGGTFSNWHVPDLLELTTSYDSVCAGGVFVGCGVSQATSSGNWSATDGNIPGASGTGISTYGGGGVVYLQYVG